MDHHCNSSTGTIILHQDGVSDGQSGNKWICQTCLGNQQIVKEAQQQLDKNVEADTGDTSPVTNFANQAP